jgi:hypothetical protein|tara:strand:+ start:175 stop:639 length:465 start_codon:yes stop_codon:yes gene_type:complete
MNNNISKYEKNRDIKLAYQNKYNAERAEQRKAKAKQYRKDHKEHNSKLAYRLKWLKAGYITEEDDFDEIYNRYITTDRCEKCTRKFGTFDRSIKLLSYGGKVYCRVHLEKDEIAIKRKNTEKTRIEKNTEKTRKEKKLLELAIIFFLLQQKLKQ